MTGRVFPMFSLRQIINRLLTKLVRFKLKDIGLVVFCFMDTESLFINNRQTKLG